MISNHPGKSTLVSAILAILLPLSLAHSILQDKLLQESQMESSSTSPCPSPEHLSLALAELRASQEFHQQALSPWAWPFSPNFKPSLLISVNAQFKESGRPFEESTSAVARP